MAGDFILAKHDPGARVRQKSNPVFPIVARRARISCSNERRFYTLCYRISPDRHHRVPVFFLLLTARRKKISRARPRAGTAIAGYLGRIDRASSISRENGRSFTAAIPSPACGGGSGWGMPSASANCAAAGSASAPTLPSPASGGGFCWRFSRMVARAGTLVVPPASGGGFCWGFSRMVVRAGLAASSLEQRPRLRERHREAVCWR